MELARVVGTVVATRKVPGLSGVKLLLVEPLDDQLQPAGEPFVACDSCQAGVGDIVHWLGGREATLALPVHYVPVDATIIGIVDEVSVAGERVGSGL
ncbi:MAG: ethanolamine utilization protein EutN [Rickettsiales bacterium]|nr:ethanolamine utilization protein EutN [Rickettsiales bacterium]